MSSPSPETPPLEGRGLRDEVSSAHWSSLRYFNAYRIIVAALFVISTTPLSGELRFDVHNPELFSAVATTYLAAAIFFHILLYRYRRHFDPQLIAQVLGDIIVLTLLAYAGGGYRSGLEVMLLVSLAGAALVSPGRMILAFAALATIAVLLEQSVWVLRYDHPLTNFFQPGLISVGYFATAIISNRLAARVIANEQIARERGEALARQVKVNELVIRDLQDGVLVVDNAGLVQQHNPPAGVFLGATNIVGSYLGSLSGELAQAWHRWRDSAGRAGLSLVLRDRKLRARFNEAGVSGAAVTVIYLEDESKLEERAQQVKLAALGRLTANIAHEIRNPLSAIVHAADLMDEENRAPARGRLTRIIRDNAGRLDRMVKDVLELNRRDRAQRESLDLRNFLGHCLREIGENEGIPAEAVQLDANTAAVVEFDRVHLHQVLWNLVRNAWRHSRREAGSVRLRLDSQGDRLELHVLDDGPGVPQELQSQLFEPFFTTYSGGTGLGLYIARELCSANDAALEYCPGEQGADFCISWQNQVA